MKKSEIKCKHCSNNLYMIKTEEYVNILIEKKAIDKKDKEGHILASILFPKPFYCKKCKVLLSFYSTMGKILTEAKIKTETL